jgi:hypothetical protein
MSRITAPKMNSAAKRMVPVEGSIKKPGIPK